MYELMIKSNLLKILIASNLYQKLSTIMLKVKKEVNFNYSNSLGVSNDKLKVLLLYTCTSNSALGKL